MAPFIIWAATRTGSSNLAEALGADNEPFQGGPPPGRLRELYEDFLKNQDIRPFEDLFGQGQSFKHIPEDLDDRFNHAIALLSTAHGYRHLHLTRRDEVARLLSLDVAGQLDAWWPHDAQPRFDELRRGARRLNPLDVTRLLKNSARVRQAWLIVRPHLHPTLEVQFEDMTAKAGAQRHRTLQKIADFLELSASAYHTLDVAMMSGGQNTAQIRSWVPNLDELEERLRP